MTEMQKILSDRKDKYGDFRYQADLSVSLKRVMREGNAWHEMHPYMHEALDMIQHKIARILNGDPYYEDSWVDVIGYAQLALDRTREDAESRRIVEAFNKIPDDNVNTYTVQCGAQALNSEEIAQTLRHNGVGGGGSGRTTVITSVSDAGTISEFLSR